MMIDLSKFVNKKVRVTYRTGKVVEGRLKEIYSFAKPYLLFDGVCSISYTRTGMYFANIEKDAAWDIIQIEEIKSMSKYEELKRQAAELQKEIDRLEREEKKCLKLHPVEITRILRFTLEEYFKYCKRWSVEPTEDGYVEYYSTYIKDFTLKDYTQEIKVIEGDY